MGTAQQKCSQKWKTNHRTFQLVQNGALQNSLIKLLGETTEYLKNFAAENIFMALSKAFDWIARSVSMECFCFKANFFLRKIFRVEI